MRRISMLNMNRKNMEILFKLIDSIVIIIIHVGLLLNKTEFHTFRISNDFVLSAFQKLYQSIEIMDKIHVFRIIINMNSILQNFSIMKFVFHQRRASELNLGNHKSLLSKIDYHIDRNDISNQ